MWIYGGIAIQLAFPVMVLRWLYLSTLSPDYAILFLTNEYGECYAEILIVTTLLIIGIFCAYKVLKQTQVYQDRCVLK